MHRQVRIFAAMAALFVLAIVTGTVLLLGYALAAVAMGMIVFILARRMIRRLADARLSKPRLLRRPKTVITAPTHDEDQRRAA